MDAKKCLVVGCGYLGHRVARLWQHQGREVLVTTRSEERAQVLDQEGFTPLVIDVTDQNFTLPAAEVVLMAVGYDRNGSASQQDVYVRGLKSILDRLGSMPEVFVYVSSTGVFGQSDDTWVNEQSPCNPTRAGGKICLEAERVLQAHAVGRRAVILRLAGIYGPGRVPYLARLRSGQPLAVPRNGYLNLIHVDDAAKVVLAAADRAEPPDIFVVSDGHPVIRQTFYEEIGQRLNRTIQFEKPATDDPRALRSMSSKRIDNRRMCERLDVSLAYPSYVDGLSEILDTGEPDSER